MKRRLCALLLVALGLLLGARGASAGSAQGALAQAAPQVYVATVDGPIIAIVSDYLDRALTLAEAQNADALIVRLNTPGGDLGSTERILQRFGAARVPVIVYVSPRRGEAFSAGTFITLAGQLAVMAPETKIGAAKPISGSGENLDSDSRDKAVQAMRASVRTITRNRPPGATEWAEKTITEAVAATEEEAFKLGVIDLIASDMPDLLAKADGREVKVGERALKLRTAGAAQTEIGMTLGESLLAILVDPNVAVILLFIAINGLLIEWQSPGVGVGGIIGAIAFLLFLYAAGTLSVNLLGLIFIGFSIVLFIFDLTATQHGVLTMGGIASFVIGALILFEPSYVPVSLGLLALIALMMGGLFVFIFGKGYAVRRLKPATGAESLVGRRAQARTALAPAGYVFVEGERWDAVAEGEPIESGGTVTILAVDGLKLRVKKA